ncbi:MAG: transglutaminase domain-containing protein [Oscillospiraceae bacterium]|nr:transglutaminase domain-containing protein [Oscillospiraceae bacterium]
MKKQRAVLSRTILDWILVMPGLLGSVFCLITAFDLPASRELLWIALGSVTLFSLVLGHEKQDRLVAPLLLVGLIIPAYLFRSELLESFRNLWGVLSSTYAKGYDFFRDYVPREATTPETVGTALLALTVLEAYICCLSVRIWKRTTPVALALMICIAPCFVLIDTPPDELPLLAAVFTVLTQAFSQSVRRRGAGDQFKSVGLSALLAAAILGSLLMIFPRETYTPPFTLDGLVEKFGPSHYNEDRGPGPWENPASLDLSGLPALPNRPIPMLYVTSSVDADLYLRGSSYSDFNGITWSQNTENDWGQVALFPYLGWRNGESLSVETVDTETVLYTTYQLTQMPGSGEVVSDSYVRNNQKSTRYSMHFLVDPDPITPNKLYNDWVYENCLNLPTKTREGMLAWLAEQKIYDYRLPTDPAELEKLANDIAGKVAACGAAYSRNPAKMPEGEDFCTWFLNDAEEGYCVHYASSCAALYRALGIPARYVSGYICEAKAGEEVRVTNLHAHAWVEAWIGGRWLAFEPTPGEATEFTGLIPETPYESRPTEETEPEYTRPNDPRKPRPSETNPDVPTSSPDNPNGSGNGNSESSEPADLTLLWIFLGVVGVPLLIIGRRRLKLRLWDKRVTAAQPNDKARLLYRRMLRLKKHGGGKLPEQAVTLAKKARFSQHTLDDDEVASMRLICDEMSSRVSISGFWNRIYCKFVLGII